MTEPGKEDPSQASKEMASVPSLPEAEVQSAVRKLAKDKPDILFEMMQMSSSIGNPLHQKMTEAHISQVIELATKHDEREYDLHKRNQENEFADGKSNRGYFFAAFLVLVVLMAGILYYYKDKTDVLMPILTGMGGLVSGFLGGWGFGRKNS